MKTKLINESYSIREDGVVTNILTGRILKPSEQSIKGVKTGYIYVNLLEGKSCNWKLKRTAIHRLLAIAFIPNPENKPWVNHIDKNRSNNNLDNLEWSTISENIQHSYDNGRCNPKGKDHWRYGKEATEQSRALMSASKRGVKHPKFNGIYVVLGKVYHTSYTAAKELQIHPRTIIQRCASKKYEFRNYFKITCLD